MTTPCSLGKRHCQRCAFCTYANSAGSVERLHTNAECSIELFETLRLCAVTAVVSKSTALATSRSTRPVARSIGHMVVVPRAFTSSQSQSCSVAEARLRRFLRLVEHLDKAPWASIVFNINDLMIRRMTASHLHLIVGKEHFSANNRSKLYHLIAPSLKLDGVKNIAWVTNRQQGKTSTVGKFIAALSIASPVGGQLINVYSTSLDRANELTKAAKQYVDWMMTTEGQHPEWTSLRYTKNTYQQYTIQAADGAARNSVVSKPKNPDSCRGDAPSAAFFDEIGFMTSDFWYKFALPLLQVTDRIATCTTTPPPLDSFFAIFITQIIARNKKNDYWFALYNHSLACEQCIEMMEADKCCHNLHFIPPWKCMLQFTNLRNLMPKNQIKNFQKEVYGVLDSQQHFYFPKKLLAAVQARARHGPSFVCSKIPLLWVAIDPAGHGVSEMGMVATIVSPDTAMTVIVGASSMNVGQCEVTQIQALVRAFVRRLRAHPLVHKLAPIVPIVECNNNHVFAMSIVMAFREFAPIFMPFTRDRFRSHIIDGIGVTTTHDNKQSMVTAVYQQIVEGRVVLSAHLCTACRHDIDGRVQPTLASDAVDDLLQQLGRVRDHPDGTISGKTDAGDNDDLAMAFMMGVYWSLSVRASDPRACM
jgi:hypothetical protein